MATAVTPALVVGHYIVGELIGIEPARDYTRSNGQPGVARPKVRLLVGTRLEVIPFKDEAAIRTAIGDAKERDVVAIPVYVNGPWNEALGRSGPPVVEFSGRVLAGED